MSRRILRGASMGGLPHKLIWVAVVVLGLASVWALATMALGQSSREAVFPLTASSWRWPAFPRRMGPSPIGDVFTPPLQDNLDRFLQIPPDPSLAPNLLSQLDIANTLGFGGGWGSGDFTGGGTPFYGGNPSIAARLLPTHVRPPTDSSYKQVGILSRARTESDSSAVNASTDIIPLMGQQLNGDKWRYFTMLGGNLQTKLPIRKSGGKKCTSEYGCDELSNQDTVDVTGLGTKYLVDIYDNGTFFR